MPQLGVNIDHVATLRQARYRLRPFHPTAEPRLLDAAREAEAAGAHGITVHLREDRRHVQDGDVYELRRAIRTRLNLEMAVTEEMTQIALKLRPDEVCLVPENRQEVTTEGGLDVAGALERMTRVTERLNREGILVSAFIDPVPAQVQAAARCGAACVELHTGAYADAAASLALPQAAAQSELARHTYAARLALDLGLQVNAGHGLDYENVGPYLVAVPGVAVLNIGHAIVARALFVGLNTAVAEMLAAMTLDPVLP